MKLAFAALISLKHLVMDILQDQLADFFGRQNKIDLFGRDRIAGHIGVLGRFRFLGDGQTALRFDRLQPQAAIAARTGEHDPDGAITLILRQGAEKEIDRQAVAAHHLRFEQLQVAIFECQVAARWNHVNTVRLHFDIFRHLGNGHGGVTLEDFGQDGFVGRAEVLDHYKGHAVVGRQRSKELLKSG